MSGGAKLDAAVDALRAQFGEDVIRRARFFWEQSWTIWQAAYPESGGLG